MAPVKYLNSTNWATVQVKAANVYVNDTNVPVVYLFNLGTPYRADGQDVVITTSAGALVPREISPVGDGTYVIYYRDPAQTALGGGTELFVQWGGDAVNVADDLTTWQNCHSSTDDYILVVHGEETSANLVDASGNYTATDSNISYADTGKILKAPDFNGSNSYSNWGEVSELVSAATYSASFWLNQDVKGAQHFIYRKDLNSTANIYAAMISNDLWVSIDDGAGFVGAKFSTASTSAGTWYKFLICFDGSQIVADRIKLYINGVEIAPSSTNLTPATTPNTTGADFTLGFSSTSLDGKLDEFRIFSGCLSENQEKTQYDNQNLFSTNGSLDVGNSRGFGLALYRCGASNNICISL